MELNRYHLTLALGPEQAKKVLKARDTKPGNRTARQERLLESALHHIKRDERRKKNIGMAHGHYHTTGGRMFQSQKRKPFI